MATPSIEGDPPAPLLLTEFGEEVNARLFLRGTAVSLNGQGVLFLGPSGSGKSSCALALMAHAAQLIADDGVFLEDGGQEPHRLTRPENKPELIEARGVGLLNSGPVSAQAPLALVVDLGQKEAHRLPPPRQARWKSQSCCLILGQDQPILWAYILQVLRAGIADPK